MPDFFAFAGLRYDCDAAGTGLEHARGPTLRRDRRRTTRRARGRRSPHNAVRLLLPRDESGDGDRYELAAADRSPAGNSRACS